MWCWPPGLAALGLAQGIVSLTLAWLILGIGMAIGLYDPAFATLTRLYGRDARASITGITLIAGFASTVGWPASAWFEHAFGWREACLIWAGLNLLVALPLNWLIIPPAPPLLPRRARGHATSPRRSRRAARCRSSPSISARPRLSPAQWQRICRASSKPPAPARRRRSPPARSSGRRRSPPGSSSSACCAAIHPVWSARIAALMHPLGAAVLGALGPAGVALFALLHGAGNGLITIARGTLPLAIFGPVGYGLRTGILAAPARVALSAAPFLFGVLLDWIGHFRRAGVGRAQPCRLRLAVAVAAAPRRGNCAGGERLIAQPARVLI